LIFLVLSRRGIPRFTRNDGEETFSQIVKPRPTKILALSHRRKPVRLKNCL
jgi:hypothetical protein